MLFLLITIITVVMQHIPLLKQRSQFIHIVIFKQLPLADTNTLGVGY